MAISLKKERDLARELVIAKSLELFATQYDDVMLVKSNEFVFPLVGCEGTELFGRVTISIPTGTKDEPYDGYALAQDYTFSLKEKEEKAKAKAEEKARKKAKDEELRRKRAEAKGE